MRTLREGMIGDDVERWKSFLKGREISSKLIINETFDNATKEATKRFQINSGLMGIDIDGVVGPRTLAKALNVGFDPLDDDDVNENGPNWPEKPAGVVTSPEAREKMFGKFAYVASPTNSNPEAITITDDWVKNNLIIQQITQLKLVKGAPPGGIIQVHKAIAKQLVATFTQWEQAGVASKVLTWGGCWSPRFTRGSNTNLSNHAYATAFDINVEWNGLGVTPALKDQKGSVRELVQIAFNNGFFWGGWWPKRRDGMHFEAYKIL